MRKEQLDPIVKKIALANTRPLIDLALLDIQQEVERQTGYSPSTSILSACLARIGIVISTNGRLGKGRRWAWKHNGGHE